MIIIQPHHTEYIDCEDAIDDNFLYLYSDNNKGIIYNDKNIISEMNNEHDSIIYSIKTSECIISIQSSYNNNFSLYYWYENNKKFLNNIEFNTRSLIEIERDFPLEFYSEIDGTKDINFNIDILELQKENIENEKYISDYFKIEAYIIDENGLENIKKNKNINSSVFKGFYDPGFRTGKILISKSKIKENLNLIYKNFFYIKISNKEENKNKYTKIKALVSFTNLNNIYKIVPSNTYIRSNLIPGQKTPNLYLLKNKISNKIRLEFSASSKEIDFALLNYTQYELGDQRFYKNDSKIHINFKKGMGKYYFEFFTDDSSIDSIVLSIFSNNENNIAGNEVLNISYTFKYYISNDNNFNIINTVDSKLGEKVEHKTVNLTENKTGIYIKFPKLIYKKNVLTDSKYFLKFYPIENRSLSIYNSICLFESEPYQIVELKNNESKNNYLEYTFSDFPENKTYLLIISSLSEELNIYKPIDLSQDSKENNSKNSKKKWIYIIIGLAILIIIIIIIIIFIYKKIHSKNNNISEEGISFSNLNEMNILNINKK